MMIAMSSLLFLGIVLTSIIVIAVPLIILSWKSCSSVCKNCGEPIKVSGTNLPNGVVKTCKRCGAKI